MEKISLYGHKTERGWDVNVNSTDCKNLLLQSGGRGVRVLCDEISAMRALFLQELVKWTQKPSKHLASQFGHVLRNVLLSEERGQKIILLGRALTSTDKNYLEY